MTGWGWLLAGAAAAAGAGLLLIRRRRRRFEPPDAPWHPPPPWHLAEYRPTGALVGPSPGRFDDVDPSAFAADLATYHAALPALPEREDVEEVVPAVCSCTFDDERDRLLREASTASPHVRAATESGVDGDTLRVLRPAPLGPTLAERMAQGPLPPDLALEVVLQVITAQSAVLAADALGVALGEPAVPPGALPPDRIHLAPTPSLRAFVQIHDLLGGVRQSGTCSRCQDLFRPWDEDALPYAAPEILSGHPVDERSTVWSAAMLLYGALAGAVPWGEDTLMKNASKRILEEVPPLPDSVPASLSAAVRLALSRSPDERPPTLRHLGAILVEAARRDGIALAEPLRALGGMLPP